ncbi:MAG: hypothetical protein SF051_04495 [Elusimicrobiota bacterium]|nr:hypothetical protein [Elusimicrobiota bacterium]
MPPTKSHQLLHGYSRGHTLLAGSIDLPPDIQRQLAVLSDLSGAASVRGFESYITGYPLPKIGYFALARTWTAPEMPRPGCVWTHTLLLDFNTLGGISSFAQIEQLFRRPEISENGGFESYSNALNELPAANQVRTRNQELDRRIASQVLFGLYEAPKRPVILLADSSEDFEQLVISIWLQQWADLRKSFAFCTGAISPRQLNSVPFDLQICPQTGSRNVRREAPAAIIIDPDADRSISCEWVDALTDDINGDGDSHLREFLGIAGKGIFDRTLAGALADIFVAAKTDPSPTALLSVFLKPHRYNALKSIITAPELFSQAGFPTASPYRILEHISRTSAIPSEYGLAAAATLAELLTKRDSDQALSLAADLGSGRLNEFGQSLLAALIEQAPTEKLVQFLPKRRELVYGLIHRRPSLAGLPELWQLMRANQTDLADALIRTNPEPKVASAVIQAVLRTRSKRALGRLASQWPEMALNCLLDFITQEQPASEWADLLDIVSKYPEIAVELLAKHELPPSLIADILSLLDPHDSRLAEVDFSTWLRLGNIAQGHSREHFAASIQAFLSSVAFASSDSKRSALLLQNFAGLHSALEEDRLNADAWSHLSRHLPELGWWQYWDKCEKLRRGVLKEIAAAQPELLREFFLMPANEKTISYLVESLLSLKNGKSLLKKLAVSGTFDQQSPQLRRSIESTLR